MNRRSPLLVALLLIMVALSQPSDAVGAPPGQAFLVLTPAPAAGDFDVEAYLNDPIGWPALAANNPDGWAVMYRSSWAPAGWSRPFVIRAGGLLQKDGEVHPRYSLALSEMLPDYTTVMLAQRAAPNPDACSPGQPNPMPLARDGWRFIHDGWVSVSEMNRDLWELDLDTGWDQFKRAYPRDFNGNFQSHRGNAGEIYFLTLLFELDRAAGDMLTAITRTLHRLSSLPQADSSQFNAIIQGESDTWAIRYAVSEAAQYRIHYTRTTSGGHCITDSLPAGSGSWQEVPNFHLARFADDSPVVVYPIEFSAVDDSPDTVDPKPEAGRSAPLRLVVNPSPALGKISLRFAVPEARGGFVELVDLEGRRLVGREIFASEGRVTLVPPSGTGSGLYWLRLVQGGRECRRRVVFLR